MRYEPLITTPMEYRLRFTHIVFRSMLRRACIITKLHSTRDNSKQKISLLRFQVLDALFECPCGIPLAGSQRVITFANRQNVSLLQNTIITRFGGIIK